MLLSVFARVFSKGRYLLLSLAIFVVGLSLVLLLPNQALIQQIFSSDTAGLGLKLAFVWSLYGSIVTNFTLVTASYSIVLVLLISIDIALFVFYIRRAQKVTKGLKQERAKSLAGIVSGVLGIGCAACGSVILTGIAASLGATGLLLALPLHGGEFALVGIVLLSWSIWYLVKKINDPLVCAS